MVKCPLPKEGSGRQRAEAQLFVINNVIASLANAFPNLLTPPGSVQSRFPPIGRSGSFPDPGGRSPEGRTHLVNPGMSKAREPEEQREKETALAVRGGPSEQFLNFGLLWARGAG